MQTTMKKAEDVDEKDNNDTSEETTTSSTTTEENNQEGCYCDGCGEGPRTIIPKDTDDTTASTTTTTTTTTIVPLKRCTRCHKAYYHDSICQRNHWPIHRKVCCQKQQQQRSSSSKSTTSSQPLSQQQKNKKNRVALPSVKTSSTSTVQQEKYRIEKRPGKGYCLIANRPYSPGMMISPPTQPPRGGGGRSVVVVDDDDSSVSNSRESSCSYFEPFVLPVLLESCRSTRCAYCFGKITTTTTKNTTCTQILCNLDTYKVYVCSKECYERAVSSLIRYEIQALNALYNSPGSGPPKVLSSAIFVYRLLLAVAFNQVSWDHELRGMVGGGDGDNNDVEKLRSDDGDSDSDDDDDEQHHERAVIMTVQAMMAYTRYCGGDAATPITNNVCTSLRSFTPQDDAIISILTKMKLNSFSIVDNDNDKSKSTKSETLGFGLYKIAYRINHSCNPNAVQSFMIANPGNAPKLQITACQPITPNDEICISYIELLKLNNINSKSTKQRQRELLKNYKFTCTCGKCYAADDDEVE